MSESGRGPEPREIPGPVLRAYLRAVLPADVAREIEADLAEETRRRLRASEKGHGGAGRTADPPPRPPERPPRARPTPWWVRLKTGLWAWSEALRVDPWALRRGFEDPDPGRGGRARKVVGSGGSHRRWRVGVMGATDAKVAVRSLVRRPRGAGLVVVTVALAVTASAVVFSVFDGVLLTPLPYEEPGEILQISRVNLAGLASANPRSREMAADGPVSLQLFEAWRDGSRALVTAGAYTGAGARFGVERPILVAGAAVTSSVFEVLGVSPALGRLPGPEIDRPGATPVVVLSHGFWIRELGGDPSVVGSTIALNGEQIEVVAVMPPEFAFPNGDARLWRPLPERIKTAGPGSSSLRVVARRRAGVSPEAVTRELNGIIDALAEEDPGRYGELEARVVPFLDGVVGETRAILALLVAGMGLLLLSTALNASLVLMARTISRARELATRAALGASRPVLTRGVVVEALLLVGLGGAAGVALAALALDPVVSLLPPDTPRVEAVSLHGGVVGVTLGVILLAGLAASLLPTWRILGLQPGNTLRSGTRTGTARRDRRVVEGLVVAEVVLAFVAVGGAGLLGRSFTALTDVPIGFQAEGLVAVSFGPSSGGGPEEMRTRLDAMTEALEAYPEVVEATVASNLPFSGSWTTYTAYAAPGAARDSATVSVGHVSPDYFEVMRIPLEAGSTLSDRRDEADDQVVVSRTAAELFWPGENPVGRGISVGDPEDEPLTVRGVVADVRHVSLAETPEAKVYLPADPGQSVHLAIRLDPRLDVPPPDLEERVRETVWGEDPGALVWGFQDVEASLDDALAPSRFRLALFLSIGLVTVLISVIGVYGLTSFRLSEGIREYALRKALGAPPRSLTSRVLHTGVRPVIVGLLLGTGAAWWLAPLVGDFLFRVEARDAVSFAVGALLLLAAGGLAVLVPVRRVSAVDPVDVLRDV